MVYRPRKAQGPSPEFTDEQRQKGRLVGHTKKNERIFSRLSADGREVALVMSEGGDSLETAVKKVTAGDPTRARAARKNIRGTAGALEFIYDNQRLKLVPALALLAKANMWLERMVDQRPLCDECGKDLEFDPKHILAAINRIHDSLKESGALSLYEKALQSDMQDLRSRAELAEEILGARPKRIEQPDDACA